ncbi:Uncharacterised protein [Salmonella enterica subsp. enterica serovar Typhi]|nr:hypothetical protein RU61_03014 [Salmonella enterica subsp. enterica serovar Derby]CER44907.1 Uncharacterised protein [Salmonella enterica subsp. enterica serovar Typhi]CFZ54845.1 Uncharacterised protein [Salmonella enterica subsp. enterica serovar Typhi]CGX37305.1 Uncharacterised protein [Salmonella enterica subsp. enterica serovar Typhi]CHB69219.1 Uncharacterised protein [Salmonella enterica subsp. enterica serovar Typhi]
MFQPRLQGIRCGKVQVYFHRKVRRQLTPVFRRQIHNLQERRDTADTRRIWLNEIAGIAQNQLLVFPETGQHFPGGDRRIQRGSKLGVAFDVVSI